MCGIAGVAWTSTGQPVDRERFNQMTDSMAHRGPDGRGIHRQEFSDGSGITLGHRRLSIIDLAGGAQPMSNEDDSVWVSFNGEIYNYRELRPQLEQAGHQFRTNSDSETIVHLYEEYGEAFVSHLRGMFAIALWDNNHRRLILARDRLGQKPLVYNAKPDRLTFASEIKALLQLPETSKEIRHESINDYLTYGYVPHPWTIYQDIKKLPPAHLAIYENGQFTTKCYWNPDLRPDPNSSVEELKDELQTTLSESVGLRMRSDVPLGAFLSGGIDSTVITGVMQELSSQPTKTFTIGFPVDGFDESAYAQAAATHLGTEHQLLEVKPDSVELLNKLAWLFDEPFADSSAVPTYYVSELTRDHVVVALTGDGGDELFAGYDRYPTVHNLRRVDRMPTFLRKAISGPMAKILPGKAESSFTRRLRNRMQIMGGTPSQRYCNWVTYFPLSLRNELYHTEWSQQFNELEQGAFISELFSSSSLDNGGLSAMRTDLRSYLPCDLLAKVDITSMAHGLECRSPFLDHKVVEAAGKFKFAEMTQPGRTKPILTDTFAKHFPESLKNRKKMGFTVPLDSWFRNSLQDYSQDMLLAEDAFCSRYFKPSAIENMLRDHHTGKWNHGERIWSLLFLETWGKSQVS
jgi:asparagine synthase (glutamine-hydrolysing)